MWDIDVKPNINHSINKKWKSNLIFYIFHDYLMKKWEKEIIMLTNTILTDRNHSVDLKKNQTMVVKFIFN